MCVLDHVAEERSYTRKLRSNNSPEIMARVLEAWAEENKVELALVEPGKPTQNGYVERFSRTLREEVLDLFA